MLTDSEKDPRPAIETGSGLSNARVGRPHNLEGLSRSPKSFAHFELRRADAHHPPCFWPLATRDRISTTRRRSGWLRRGAIIPQSTPFFRVFFTIWRHFGNSRMKCPSFIPTSTSNPLIRLPISGVHPPQTTPPDNGGSDELAPRSIRTAGWHTLAPSHGARGDPTR